MTPSQRSAALWAGGLAALPIVLTLVLRRDPPIGIYLQGAVLGSLSALVAVGLVLVHRATRVISFAQASIGAVPATLALLLVGSRGWPWPVAVLVLVVTAAAIGALVDVAIVARFRQAPRLILTVATIGVAQVLAFTQLFLPRWVSGESNPLAIAVRGSPVRSIRGEVGGVVFTGDHVLAVVVVGVVASALTAFFRRTTAGIAIRAAAEDSDRAALLGVRVASLSTAVWAGTAVLSAVGAFLRAPLVSALPGSSAAGPDVLLFALAPAVIARMEKIPQAAAAAIGLGMLDQAIFYSTGDATTSTALLLPIVLVALLLQRRSTARADEATTSTWRQAGEVRRIPAELRRVPEVVATRAAAIAVLVTGLVALPFLIGATRRDIASLMVIYAIIGVSLVVLAGWSGQISLGQFALAGVGSAVTGGLVGDAHWDSVPAIVLGALAASAVAVVLGIPALRLPGLLLGVATLAFAVNTQTFFLNPDRFGWLLPEQGNFVERPVLLGWIDTRSDTAFYYLCLAVLGLVMLGAGALRARRGGRVLIGGRDNPRAAQALAVPLTRVRLAAFAISGAIAGLGGGLFVHLQGVVDAPVFGANRSLLLFSLAVIGGLTSVGGALAGAAYLAAFQYFLPEYQLLASGAGMLVLLLVLPGGLADGGARVRDAWLRWVAGRRGIHVPSLLADSRTPSAEPAPEPVLIGAATASGQNLVMDRA